MSAIAALPYPWDLPTPDSGNTVALVMIDMQRDFIEEGGFGSMLGNQVSRLQACIPAAQQLLTAFRELGLPIIHTQEGHQPDLSDCPPSKRTRGNLTTGIGDSGPLGRILVLGEPGNDFVPALEPLPGEIILPKPGKGAFYNTPLQEILTQYQATHLILGGVTTEVCVQTTMREANDRGYDCLLVEDATESYFPEFKQATLEMVRAQGGIVGWTASAQTTIEGLKAHYGTL